MAYKAQHSCKTALLRVQHDILHSMDKGKVGALLLLDLSSAFDTADHRALLDRLQEEVGLGGTILD